MPPQFSTGGKKADGESGKLSPSGHFKGLFCLEQKQQVGDINESIAIGINSGFGAIK
jgi:hypothetical protein